MNTKQKTGIFTLAAIVGIITISSIVGIQESSAAQQVTYEVTVTNITPGQPLTPPLLVTHTKNVSLYSVGDKTGAELQQLAENGNTAPLVEKITDADGIYDIVQGTAPLVPANDPGNTELNYSETFTITADSYQGYISFVSMLVCTNDGFAGIDTVKLPYYSQKTIYAKGYDARTEANTEKFEDLVPPCQGAIGATSDVTGTGESNPELAEDGIIIPHVGITGKGDLTMDSAWSNPVVKIDIVRVK